jgi:hypothetical protein
MPSPPVGQTPAATEPLRAGSIPTTATPIGCASDLTDQRDAGLADVDQPTVEAQPERGLSAAEWAATPPTARLAGETAA